MTRIHCLKIQKFTKKVGGEPFNGNRRKVKHHDRLSDSAPPPQNEKWSVSQKLANFPQRNQMAKDCRKKYTQSVCTTWGNASISL